MLIAAPSAPTRPRPPVSQGTSWTMHAGQYAAFSASNRIKVLVAGRRWGKSEYGVMEMLTGCRDDTLRGIKGVSWVVMPTYKVGRVLWRKFVRLAPKGWITNVYGTERMPDSIDIGTSTIEFRSAENPDTLVAEALRRVLIDECGIIKEKVWSESIQPTLIDYESPALLTGTPKGRNWFYRMWLRGRDPKDLVVGSFGGPSHMNPFIPQAEVERLRYEMPERTYRQEILAQFLTDEGAVFRGVRQCVWTDAMPRPGETVAWGVDLAKYADFTVIVGMDANGAVTEFERFNRVSWPLQKARITERCGTLLPIVIDANGVGDPIVDDLMAVGLNVQPFKINSSTKVGLIEALVIAIEQKRITLPDEPVLLNELEAFEYEQTAGGYVKYQAPEGLHDDCVIALALVWQSVGRYGATGILV